jgi:hypothetical protein
MRYMTLYKPGTENDMPTEKEMAAVGQLIQEMAKAEAIELTKRFLKTMGRGESEIRLMQDAPAFDAASASPSGKAGQKPRGKTAARA